MRIDISPACVFLNVALASLAVFEKLEFDDWKTDHPNGTFSEYSDEITQTVNELLMEEYQGMGLSPMLLRWIR